MTDVTPAAPSAKEAQPAPNEQDRTLPAVAYGLYLLGFVTGFTPLIGLIVAYANRDRAGPVLASHYIFLIHTFWLTLAWCVIGGVLFAIGLPFSFLLIGIPVLAASLFIFGAIGIWFAVRCILGILYLARGEAYPRPRNWLF